MENRIYSHNNSLIFKALAGTFSTITSIEELAQAIDQEIGDIIQADYTAFYLYDEENDDLRFIYAKGFSKGERLEEETLAYERHPGWVVRNKKPLDVEDVTKSAVDIQSTSQFPIGSLLFYPLLYGGKCLGTIGFVSRKASYFPTSIGNCSVLSANSRAWRFLTLYWQKSSIERNRFSPRIRLPDAKNQ